MRHPSDQCKYCKYFKCFIFYSTDIVLTIVFNDIDNKIFLFLFEVGIQCLLFPFQLFITYIVILLFLLRCFWSGEVPRGKIKKTKKLL